MKHVLRYLFLSIPNKLRCEVRIAYDNNRNPIYSNISEGTSFYSLQLYPLICLNIVRPIEIGEDGNRQRNVWNPNDNLGMTKYTLPIFLKELSGILKDMMIPELYTYHGKRLELNEEIAAKIRRPFMIGNTAVELSAVVINQPDESRVEGVKLKFNNEQSSVLLTLNDLTSLEYNLKNTDFDSISMKMLENHLKTGNTNITTPVSSNVVDILPKNNWGE